MILHNVVIALIITVVLAEDFYDLLGVAKNANEREIRKGFKNKALTLHPDKNQDDPEAHEKFVRLNRAYEVLKDAELRKKYDLFGEEGLEENRNSGHNYHSWSYYHDNFGIYDDDPEIITLSKGEFEQTVTGSEDVWFINYYHPMCSHCHTLAPVWRQVAQELEGVVRIGAVNCDDEYHLCSSQGIRSYPTIIMYPGRIKYKGERSKDELMDYMLRQVPSSVYNLRGNNLKAATNEIGDEVSTPWLIIFYMDMEDKEEFSVTEIKLGAIFDAVVNVGRVECYRQKKLCSKVKKSSTRLMFYDADLEHGTEIQALDAQEITKEVLPLLPETQLLDEDKFKVIRQKLETREDSQPWLIHFSSDSDDDIFEIRKLPGLMAFLNHGRIDCSVMKKLCDDLYIAKTPSFILFKPGGGYEQHHGRLLAHDIAVFAREGASATQFQILTPQEFPKVLSDGSNWFVDFYAPWCPPCMKLLPEFRKASRLVETPVNFGSIDCMTHSELCTRFNIRQYPTTILYNQSIPHEYHGFHSAAKIVEFVRDTVNPAVVELDAEKYRKLVENKPSNEVWVVDYFANWCGHCIQMAPEYRRFARMVDNLQNVHISMIDCAQYGSLCKSQGVSGYPTIMLYPAGSFGTQRSLKFNGRSRDADTFRQWLYNHIPSSVSVLNERSFENILNSKEPWLIDFFSPWCGHCHVFAPDFEDIAVALKGSVRAGKVDCQANQRLCWDASVRAYPSVRLFTGSVSGRRQQSYGINIDDLQKDTIINTVRRIVPQKRVRHDEL